MFSHCLFLLFTTAVIFNFATPSTRAIKTTPSALELDDDASMQERIKKEFLHAWNAYKAHAFDHDELQPLTQSARDWYDKPLLITAVDALDTLFIMGLTEEAELTIEHIATNLSFDHDMFVNAFEINIRVLGGLLGAYQLSSDKRLLAFAENLGKRLLPAFRSPTGMPYTHVNLRTGATQGSVSNPAEIGTYVVEFGVLSQLTDDPVYFEAAKNALVALYNRRSDLGLVGSKIDVQSGIWLDATSHISGGADSYYEYLFKCYKLFDDNECEQMWEETQKSLHDYLKQEINGRVWYGPVDMSTGKNFRRQFKALDAFFAGLLALDGKIDIAKKLQNTYFALWKPLGTLPESVDYEEEIYVLWDRSILRPEIIESAFYLRHITKDRLYAKMGKRFFSDLVEHCRSNDAYHALSSVRNKTADNSLESFFFAETMKYLYLLFAPEDSIDLSDAIFSTEGHIMKRSLITPLGPTGRLR